ncbi:chloride channel protein [Pseudoroseomonas ludipueritiae]|uniref:Chloride channel protein n=1 Tax=Pseudoroseomonas ludipueritiae TaxID=198093 RepID=A0ABR7RB45_9PROT|nr:chloride channel protein [Pseudoroseomonas ludipueritiae]MBC9179051.1 chloride channel protein [Pseudoroseomonas ludipueritiae]
MRPDRPSFNRRRLRRLPLLSPRQWRRRLVFWLGAALVGVVAVGFAAAAEQAQHLFSRMVAWQPLLVLLLAPGALALSLWLTQRFFPGAQGSGIPQVIAALHIQDPARAGRLLTLRIAAGKVLLLLLGLLGGASIGREGPTVQVGASIMHALGRWQRLPRPELLRLLVLAGGGAGVAAAFNTPLAGLVFAIEELSHSSFKARTGSLTLTAVVIAGLTAIGLVGNYIYFGQSTARLEMGLAWVAVPLCGLLGGLAGGLFSSMLIHIPRLLPGAVKQVALRHPVLFAAGCGLLIALIGLASGGTSYGTGYEQAKLLVEGQPGVPESFAFWKLLATVVSYLSGIPGGIFAPSLSVGAGIGHWLGALLPGAPADAVVLLGMVAYFSGVVQAPITAGVIVLEMTGNHGMAVPLMGAALIGFAASRLVCRRPLYATMARRFMAGPH